MELNEDENSLGIFNVIQIDPPFCSHGPALLFEIESVEVEDEDGESEKNGENQGKKRKRDSPELRGSFFACSAYRNSKECTFRMPSARWFRMSEERRQHYNAERMPPHTGDLVNYVFDDSRPDKEYGFCKDCCRVLLTDEQAVGYVLNPEHVFGTHVQRRCENLRGQLKRDYFFEPTKLLLPAKENKGQSQFFFAEPVINFLVEEIVLKMGFKRVLCIGCPTVFEYLFNKAFDQVSVFLVDIDIRFAQFFHPQYFSRFNMFNYFFFDGAEGEDSVREFLAGASPNEVLFICDPPFGGRISTLQRTIRRFQNMISGWENIDIDDESSPYPAFCLFFPYFNEHWIRTAFAEQLQRTDLVVFYSNHNKFKIKSGQTEVKKPPTVASPVRLFTNLDRSRIDLSRLNPVIDPARPFYSFCAKCRRYVFQTNRHCRQCNDCTARESGKIYRHCDTCGTCYKSTYAHCDKCKMCHLFLKCRKSSRTRTADSAAIKTISVLVQDSKD